MVNESKEKISSYINGLIFRGRALTLGRVILYLFASLLFIVCIAAIFYQFDMEKETILSIVALLLVVSSLGCIVWPMMRWRDLGSKHYHAKNIEALRPEIRGAVFAALDPTTMQAPGFLQTQIMNNAQRGCESSHPADLLPLRPLLTSAIAFAASVVMVIVLSLGVFLDKGPFDVMAMLLESEPVMENPGQDDIIVEDKKVAIGDINLKYIYPEYLGRKPLSLRNTGGHIHAEPNTVVEISLKVKKSAKGKYKGAFIQVNDMSLIPATFDGRVLKAQLTLQHQGVWRALFWDGNVNVPTREMDIEFDTDDPPIVTLNSDKEIMAPINRAIGLEWLAKDEYGIERVLLEVEKEGELRRFILRKTKESELEMNDYIRLRPDQIGLKSGDKASLRVVAYDNQPDSKSGDIDFGESDSDPLIGEGKRGESAVVDITVMGPKMMGRRMKRATKKFRDVMLVVLADYLEEPLMPSSKSKGMIKWVDKARKRFEPLQNLIKDTWGETPPGDFSSNLVLDTLDVAGKMMRFVLITYDEERIGRITKQDETTFRSLHAEQIQSLEKAIYLFDMMLRKLAFAEMLERSDNLKTEAEDLEKMLEEDAEVSELLAQLSLMERLLRRLKRAASDLSDSTMREFVNGRSQELSNLMSEIRKAINEKRDEDARDMLGQLAQSIKELQEGIQEQMNRQNQQGDDLQQAYDELMKSLEDQEKAQRELSKRLENARKQEDQVSQELITLWEKLLKLAEEGSGLGQKNIRLVGGGKGWRAGTIRQFNKLKSQMNGLQNAIMARDPRATTERTFRALRRLRVVKSSVSTEQSRGRIVSDPKPIELPTIVSNVERMVAIVLEMQSLLDQMDFTQEESQSMQEMARQLAAEQEALNERQESLKSQAKRVEQAMPTGDGSASEAIQEATDAMKNAKSNLEKGRSIPGEGHQRDAAQRLKNAQDNLKEQMEEYKRMMQQMQQMQGRKSGKSGSDGKNDRNGEEKHERFDLQSLDENMSPDEYRRALLKGMSDDVPDEYRRLKRRYYEELVRQ